MKKTIAIAVALSATLAWHLAAFGQQATLTEESLQRWLDAYGAAWETRDAAAASALFTNDAAYIETPYSDAFRGRTGIADYWVSVTADQRDIDFASRVLAIDGNIGIAEWSATFLTGANGERVGLDGVFVLEFDASGLCSELREWWFLRPSE